MDPYTEDLEYYVAAEHLDEVKLEGLQERVVEDSTNILAEYIHLPKEILRDMILRAILLWQKSAHTKIAAVRLMQPGHQYMIMRDIAENFKRIALKMKRFVGPVEMLDLALAEVLDHFQETYMNQDFFD